MHKSRQINSRPLRTMRDKLTGLVVVAASGNTLRGFYVMRRQNLSKVLQHYRYGRLGIPIRTTGDGARRREREEKTNGH